MHTSFQIRRYAPGEEAALRAIFRSSVRGLASRHYTTEQIDAWSPVEESAELREQWRLRMEFNQPWVAEMHGELAAFADVQQSGYIDHFFVAATFAGQGIARALMLHLHDVARSRRIATLSGHVSLAAQTFFRSSALNWLNSSVK